MPAEGSARKVSSGVPAPCKAEDQQDEIDGIIAILRKGQHPLEMDERVKAEGDHARKVDKPRQLAEIQRLDMRDLADSVEQHGQERHRQQQPAHHL